MEMDANYKKLIRIIYLISEYSEPIDYIDDIQEILESGFDVNYAIPIDCKVEKWHGCTVYHIFLSELIHEKYLNAKVNLLTRYNADFMYQNQDGCTPVHILFKRITSDENADYLTIWECIDRILSLQVESNNTKNPRCKDGISHLHIACICKNLKAVEFFLKAGASVNEAVNSDSEVLPAYTLLHLAMENQDKEMVRLLLKYGADLRCLNANGKSPLQLIYYGESLYKLVKLDFESESVQNKYTLDIISDKDNSVVSDYIGLNQLHKRCIEKPDANELDDFEKFLKDSDNDVNSHVNFDSPIWAGYTALHFAAQNDQQMVMLLLKSGADLMAKDANGITPLDLCCKEYEPSIISSILKTQNEQGIIKFLDGEDLTDFLDALNSEDKLQDYLKTTNNVNNAIPLESPLWPGYRLLHIAVKTSDRRQVKLCLDYEADFTMQDANNMTALHLAFQLNKKDCIDEILKAHSINSTNPADNDDLSHFHIACVASNLILVETFLQHKIDSNIPTSMQYIVKNCSDSGEDIEIPAGSTAFHIAAAVNSEDLLKLLVKSKMIDPNLCDADGFTWVHRAAFQTRSKLHDYLWEHPDALKKNPVLQGGLSHFHVACYTGDLRAVEALLPLITDINEPLNSELEKYVESEYEKRFTNLRLGDTPLHLAVKSCNCSEEIVDLLLENGADLTAKNLDGYNPVYVLYEKLQDNDVNATLSYNVLNHLVLELKKKGKLSDGLTALHFACAWGETFMIRDLIEKENFNSQIDADSKMWPSKTPVKLLIDFDDYDDEDGSVKLFLSYFLEKIENINNNERHESSKRQRICLSESQAIDANGLSAFHVSCMESDPQAVEKFIAIGFDVNAPVDVFANFNIAGFTPLHFAVRFGSKEVIEILLKHGADITAEDACGRTPVHLAANEWFEKVEVFVRMCNIDANMKNTSGQTLMDYLIKNTNMCAQDCLLLFNLNFFSDMNLSSKLCIYLRAWARYVPQSQFQMIIEHIPNDFLSDVLKSTDSSGRNVIHHLITTMMYLYNKGCSANAGLDEFANNIGILLNKGSDIDHQDNDGKTPLHYAVLSKQVASVYALLNNGADINITDKHGMTPYMYCYQPNHWNSYDKTAKSISEFANASVQDTIRIYFYSYSSQFRATGLHLSKMNVECLNKGIGEGNKIFNFAEELDSMAEEKICDTVSVRTLLTENLIAGFPVMPLLQREAILKYLESKKYSIWLDLAGSLTFSPLFKCQSVRLLKSVKLFEPTRDSLRALLDPRLPNHCLESIMKNLNIYDWINLQKASK